LFSLDRKSAPKARGKPKIGFPPFLPSICLDKPSLSRRHNQGFSLLNIGFRKNSLNSVQNATGYKSTPCLFSANCGWAQNSSEGRRAGSELPAAPLGCPQSESLARSAPFQEASPRLEQAKHPDFPAALLYHG
jgi:hypothetical protein